MEKNKKIIVIAAFVVCLSMLAGFIYWTFFKAMKEEQKSKFEFDVPKISDKKEMPTSKFDYYNSEIDEENAEKGFLLEKEDSIKRALELTEQGSVYKKEDFQEDSPYNGRKNYQNALSEGGNDKGQSQQNLSRLLNAMESNSKYLNNIGKKPAAFNDFQSLQGSGNKTIGDIPEEMNNVIGKYMPEKNQDPEKNDNSSGRVIYRESPKEDDFSKKVFTGVTKNKNAFTGVISDNRPLKKELVKAEIYTSQVIGNEGLVMINLLEDLTFEEDFVIPKSTVLYGTAKFAPGRMFIHISPNVFKNDRRLLRPVIVFDFDGLEGVFIETNLIGSIPVETARELTELVKESYKNSNPISGNSGAVPLKEASIVIGSEKILNYLNRLKLKISGGYKIWISVKKDK